MSFFPSHQLRAREPLCRVGVEANDVLARGVRGEGPAALARVHLGQDDLVVRVAYLHVHPDARAGGGKSVGARIVQLHLVVADDHGLVGDLLDEALALRLGDVEVQGRGQRQQAQQSKHARPQRRRRRRRGRGHLGADLSDLIHFPAGCLAALVSQSPLLASLLNLPLAGGEILGRFGRDEVELDGGQFGGRKRNRIKKTVL